MIKDLRRLLTAIILLSLLAAVLAAVIGTRASMTGGTASPEVAPLVWLEDMRTLHTLSPTVTNDTLFAAGAAVCAVFNPSESGIDSNVLFKLVYDTAVAGGLSPNDAASFIGWSVSAFCPQEGGYL